MTEEPPGGWELKRDVKQIREEVTNGFSGINSRIDKITESTVSMGAYNEAMRRIDETHRRQDQAILDERQARKEDNAEMRDAMEKTATWLRWVATGLLIPIVVPIALYMLKR